MRVLRSLSFAVSSVFALALVATNPVAHGSVAAVAQPQRSSPIQHVVVIFQENHTFDNVLGTFCDAIANGQIEHQPCDGATVGTLPDGTTIPLARAQDYVPLVSHSVEDQQRAIDQGRMDGFAKNYGCGARAHPPYRCYSQFGVDQIPNVVALATAFAVSDRTFSFRSTPSWAGHMVLASATLDGFSGDQPVATRPTMTKPQGWGCDSGEDAAWWDGSSYVPEPACVPDAQGHGPYRPSPVSYVPTIFDRLEAKQRTWKIYGGRGEPGELDYGWSICPTFYECLGSGQRQNLVPSTDVLADAVAGALPNYAVVTPTLKTSQHNNALMLVGDNWIGNVVQAIEDGPDWSSTAIFITWDDCGCFYDHVSPLTYDPSWGLREPMIIVGPYVRRGFTDPTPATFMSILAFTERTFRLDPLTGDDAAAYDYRNAFDYGTKLPGTVQMTNSPVPGWESRFAATHPVDEDDPT